VKGDGLYAHHILDCIRRIQRYCNGGAEAFFGSELIQDAVLRNLQIRGESTQRIGDGLKARHPEIRFSSRKSKRSGTKYDQRCRCLSRTETSAPFERGRLVE